MVLEYRDAELTIARAQFISCLDRRKRTVWNQEGISRAQYLYSKVLSQLGSMEESKTLLDEALTTKDYFIQQYPQHIKPDTDDLVVFDQMVSLWAGRFTGKLAQAHPAPVESTDS